MIVARFLRDLRRNDAGTAMLEFAIIGPAMILMLFGVLQVGIGLQNYNALRNASADIARFAMVQYSTGNKLSNDQMIDFAKSVAEGSPYLLNSDIRVTITDVATSRVTNAKEKTLTLRYQIPSVLASMGLEGPDITYTCPMFLAV